MKGLVTAALGALLLCCVSSVHGESFSEHNLPSTHDNSPLPVAGDEENYLLTRVVERNVGKGANSTYKEQRGHSGRLNSSSMIVDGEEIEPNINDSEQPRQRKMDFLGGQSRELSDDSSVNSLPCPLAAAIAPCVCSYDADYNIDLDCTFVASEEQLANVFQQEFPVKELRGFNMMTNGAIRVLDNILNGVTFRTVSFSPGPFVLEAISEYFFLGMKKTLSYIQIHDSQVTSSQFPFAILDEMTEVWHFSLSGSQITWIPKIKLPNVTFMQIRAGLTDFVEIGTFPILAGSYVLGIEVNVIERVEPGSFYYLDENSMTSNENVLIDISRNRLQTLEAGTVPMRNGFMDLKLYGNPMSTVAPGAFVMPETTDNPLTCGCDIAWIVTNPDYMAKVDPDATCVDGTNLHSLDPSGYITLY